MVTRGSRWPTAIICAGACWLAGAARSDPLVTPLAASERAQIVETLSAAGETVDPRAADDTIAARLLSYATRELGQRVQPSSIDRMWALEPTHRDVPGEFNAARSTGTLNVWLRSLSPPAPGYRALEAAARRYRGIAATGGWQALPPGPALRAGDRGTGVTALRARLAIEGYPAPAADQPDLFDSGLRRALATFQAHHGLPDDGVLGVGTRGVLDVPAKARVAQIEANLERWRWLPHALPADRIEVDIARAEATLFRGANPTLTMKVVVGDPRHQTPMFASALDAVVFNPPWNVPTSIAEAELLPKEAKDPGYLKRNDFIWTDGHLQQLPGPKSALGLLKFDLPSPFGVYLHDTPSRGAFQRPMRALSHGCMRLEKPQDLAERLLGAQGWTDDSIDRAIEAAQTLRVGLKVRTPLFVVYRTAVANAAGEVDFRPDVYGWDRKLDTALASVSVASAASPHPATDCAAD
jgi:murein L,D-transpeptidase YcbB/YkuD